MIFRLFVPRSCCAFTCLFLDLHCTYTTIEPVTCPEDWALLFRRLVWELREAAAARGSPEAQGEVALVQLYGMTPPPLYSKADFGGFAAPDEAAALTHLFFSATGGDAFGRAALGHKFRRGLGVPEVCPTASMYFQPLADEVIQEVSNTTKKLAPVRS